VLLYKPIALSINCKFSNSGAGIDDGAVVPRDLSTEEELSRLPARPPPRSPLREPGRKQSPPRARSIRIHRVRRPTVPAAGGGGGDLPPAPRESRFPAHARDDGPACRFPTRTFPIVRGVAPRPGISTANRAQESTRTSLSLSPVDYSFIYPFSLAEPSPCARHSDIRERYDRRYWRGARESSDSFRRVRNNLLNYRMPKVTRVPSDEGP